MPDRQQHGGLSDTFARLFPARSQKPPAAAGRHRVAAPARPREAGLAAEQSDAADGAAETGGPLWPEDSQTATVELSRPAWELTVPRGRESDRPDPMADTMQLSRLAAPSRTAEATDPDSGPDTGLDADDDADDDDAYADADLTWSESVRSLLVRQRRRLAVGAAGLAALAVLLALPPVRAQLRDSFTRLPKPYTALYFASPPRVDGTVLTVPVSVHAVNTGATAFSVRVWTVDVKGRVDDSRTADLTWDGQAMSVVVSMPVNPAADTVWASLSGSDETLHYKIAVS